MLTFLHRQNETLLTSLGTLARNVSETLGTINLLQQENTRLNEVVRMHGAQTAGGATNRPDEPSGAAHQGPQEDVPPSIPLIQRIGGRTPLENQTLPITYPSISSVPVIRETPGNAPLLSRISGRISNSTDPVDSPPPPHQPPTTGAHLQTRARGPDFQGEGVRSGQTSFAWPASRWRQRDREGKPTEKGIRRNDKGELEIGDLYTHAFILRAFHGRNTRKNTPRSIKKGSLRSWSMIESTFI